MCTLFPPEKLLDVTENLQCGNLSLSYARMDVLMDENRDVYCLEANTLPGMTPTSLIPQEAAVLGISYGELCELIIEISQSR